MGDTFQRAMAIAHDAVYKEETVKTYGRFDLNPKLAKVAFDPETDSRKVSLRWAQTPKWGEAMGTNTVQEFKKQIKEWFDIGSHQPAKKLPACRMQRLLQSMHPNRYDMPTENQIQAVITSLSGEEKKQGAAAAAKRLEAAEKERKEKECTEKEWQRGGNSQEAEVRTPGVASTTEGEAADSTALNGANSGESTTADGDNDGTCVQGTGVCAEGDGNRECKINGDSGNRGAGATNNARYNYRMPPVYATWLKEFVANDPEVKRMEARTLMIDALGLSTLQLPELFPTEDQVRRKITAIKYAARKKTGV